jgi:hypothetical protein
MSSIHSLIGSLVEKNVNRTIRVKAKQERRSEEVARRIRAMKELCHFTFVEYPRSNGGKVRFDLYVSSKVRVHELAIEGGQRFEKAMTCLQYANVSRNDFREAVSMLTVSDDSEHDFCAYESSDTIRRFDARD